jgi:hypothetical protein
MKLHQFAICVKNDGYEASLEIRKVYDLLEDRGAEGHGLVRVVDESGEDYLYPKEFFIPIELPSPLSSRTTSSA